MGTGRGFPLRDGTCGETKKASDTKIYRRASSCGPARAAVPGHCGSGLGRVGAWPACCRVGCRTFRLSPSLEERTWRSTEGRSQQGSSQLGWPYSFRKVPAGKRTACQLLAHKQGDAGDRGVWPGSLSRGAPLLTCQAVCTTTSPGPPSACASTLQLAGSPPLCLAGAALPLGWEASSMATLRPWQTPPLRDAPRQWP